MEWAGSTSIWHGFHKEMIELIELIELIEHKYEE